MTPVPEKYANYPNLWRVACELAWCKNPDKVLDALVAVAGDVLEQEKETQTERSTTQ